MITDEARASPVGFVHPPRWRPAIIIEVRVGFEHHKIMPGVGGGGVKRRIFLLLKTISSKLDDIKSETEWIYHYGSSIDSNTDNLESKLNQIINIINTLK